MTYTQIYALTLSALKNDKHIAATAFMAEALTTYSIAEITTMAVFVAAYMAAFDNENKAFKRIDRKELTAKMNDADRLRINALRVLRDSLKTFEFRPSEEKKVMAKRILDDIDLYGGTVIMTQGVDSRTGNITNLIEDMEGALAEDITALGLAEEVATLKAANQLFLQCQLDRDKSDADIGKKAMADARVETDKAWRAIVEVANSLIMYGTEEENKALVPFAKLMNVEIDKYRVQLGQGVGGNWGSGSSGSTDSEETVNLKNAIFVYANGVEVKLKVEVGTPLIAPDNTEGYRWDPEVPALMPKTSKTFREVAINPEEGEAIFHFLDHHEEMLRQHVGTELVAPLNTENCIWVPTPPQLMPAGQTNYAEELAQQILNPAENITIKFRGIDNQILHEMVVPVDYQMTEEEYPTPPEGTHWNFTLADLNLAIGMKNPGDTITVRAQA